MQTTCDHRGDITHHLPRITGETSPSTSQEGKIEARCTARVQTLFRRRTPGCVRFMHLTPPFQQASLSHPTPPTEGWTSGCYPVQSPVTSAFNLCNQRKGLQRPYSQRKGLLLLYNQRQGLQRSPTVMRPLSMESELRLLFAFTDRGSRPPGTLLKIPATGTRDGLDRFLRLGTAGHLLK